MIAAAHKLVLSSSVSYMPFSIFSQMIAAAHELLQYLCVDQVVDNASLWAERAARGPWSGMSEVCVYACARAFVYICVCRALAMLLCFDKEAEGTSLWSKRAAGGHQSGNSKVYVCVCACVCISVYVLGALALFVFDLTGGKYINKSKQSS